MRFGICYEHQLPRPWDEDSEYRLFQGSLTQVELADRLGDDYAWKVEHHFLEEYSHPSAPEVFLAAASQRTRNIRLGHGIVQLTTNHPARVAERVSTLDLLSHGREELGLGEGSSVTELHPFNLRFHDQPEFQADEARHQAWKQGVLAGDIALEVIDTEPFNITSRQAPSEELKDMVAGSLGRPDAQRIQ